MITANNDAGRVDSNEGRSCRCEKPYARCRTKLPSNLHIVEVNTQWLLKTCYLMHANILCLTLA